MCGEKTSDHIWRYWISEVEHPRSARDSSTQKTKAIRLQPADDPRIVFLRPCSDSEEQTSLWRFHPEDEVTLYFFRVIMPSTSQERLQRRDIRHSFTDSDKRVTFAQTMTGSASQIPVSWRCAYLLVEPSQAFNNTFQRRLGMFGVLNLSLGVTLSLTNFLNPCLETT